MEKLRNKHNGTMVEAFQFTLLTLHKENNHLLPEWLQKKVIYDPITTYVQVPRKVPEKGEAAGMPAVRDNPRFDKVPLANSNWVINHPQQGLQKWTHNNIIQNYTTQPCN